MDLSDKLNVSTLRRFEVVEYSAGTRRVSDDTSFVDPLGDVGNILSIKTDPLLRGVELYYV